LIGWIYFITFANRYKKQLFKSIILTFRVLAFFRQKEFKLMKIGVDFHVCIFNLTFISNKSFLYG